jgi:hypothetical protein
MRPTMKPEANDQSYFGMAFTAGHGDPDSCAGAGRTTVVALSPIFAEPTVYGAHAQLLHAAVDVGSVGQLSCRASWARHRWDSGARHPWLLPRQWGQASRNGSNQGTHHSRGRPRDPGLREGAQYRHGVVPPPRHALRLSHKRSWASAEHAGSARSRTRMALSKGCFRRQSFRDTGFLREPRSQAGSPIGQSSHFRHLS